MGMGEHNVKWEYGPNVLDAAKDRLRHAYKVADDIQHEVVVCTSGGKDSAVITELTAEIARELGRLPVRLLFMDNEAVHPECEEYMLRLADRKDEFHIDWFCLPFWLNNSTAPTAGKEPGKWGAWMPEERHLWVRDMPTPRSNLRVITESPAGLNSREMFKMAFLHYYTIRMRYIGVAGMRAEESPVRTLILTSGSREPKDGNWASPATAHVSADGIPDKAWRCLPIYDWRFNDLWKYLRTRPDYPKHYDILYQIGEPKQKMRTSCPFNFMAIRSLESIKLGWPEQWNKWVQRAEGINTAEKLVNTSLYGRITKMSEKERREEDWFLAMDEVLKTRRVNKLTDERIIEALNCHMRRTHRGVHQCVRDPVSGVSWQELFKLAASDKWQTQGRVYITYSGYAVNWQRLGYSERWADAGPEMMGSIEKEKECTRRHNRWLVRNGHEPVEPVAWWWKDKPENFDENGDTRQPDLLALEA